MAFRGSREVGVCESCGGNRHLHGGLCRRCRRRLLPAERPALARRLGAWHDATLEPAHARPWIHRLGNRGQR